MRGGILHVRGRRTATRLPLIVAALAVLALLPALATPACAQFFGQN
jgi:hypothetical protein